MDPNQKVVYSIIEEHLKRSGKEGQESYSLIESLGLRERELISLVGAGGKTSLMFRLAKELVLQGKKVVTTTTTKILEPSEEETDFLLVDLDEVRLKKELLESLRLYCHLTVAAERIESRKLRGVSSDFVNELSKRAEIDTVIVEADGAAGRPAKAPREWEPVIPSRSTVVVGLLGVDGVGKELNEENFFQAVRISRLTKIPVGEKMSCEGMAKLVYHPEGIFKGTPSSSRRVAFINKMDLPEGIGWGREIAGEILRKGSREIERVVLGQVQGEPPVLGVLLASDEKE